MRTLANRRKQHGVSIFMAIFLLLLFGVIAALLVSLVSTAHMTQAQDIEGVRTYQAARAGLEWGMYKLDGGGSKTKIEDIDCFPTETLTQLAGYKIVVSCRCYPGGGASCASSYAEGADRKIRLFLVSAVATSEGGPRLTNPPDVPLPVERQLEAVIEKCRIDPPAAAPNEC